MEDFEEVKNGEHVYMENVRASAKLPLLGGDVDHQMAQANAHHVVRNDSGARGLSALKFGLQGSNEGGSLMCHGDRATKNKKM